MSRQDKVLFFFAILSTCLSTTLATQIDHEDCGTEGIIYSVEMTGCSNDYPEADPGADEICIVDKGAKVHGEVHFESGFDAEYLDCAIMGVINGLEEPFPGACTQTGDVCLDLLEGDCPIEAGELVLYQFDMSVLESYPAVEAQAKWMLMDELENIVVCFLVDIEVLP